MRFIAQRRDCWIRPSTRFGCEREHGRTSPRPSTRRRSSNDPNRRHRQRPIDRLPSRRVVTRYIRNRRCVAMTTLVEGDDLPARVDEWGELTSAASLPSHESVRENKSGTVVRAFDHEWDLVALRRLHALHPLTPSASRARARQLCTVGSAKCLPRSLSTSHASTRARGPPRIVTSVTACLSRIRMARSPIL